MKYFLFFISFYSATAIACDRKIPINVSAEFNKFRERIEIKLEAPLISSGFRLSNAFFEANENSIPMHRGFQIDGKGVYYLTGKYDFLKSAKVEFVFTGLESLCAHTEQIELSEAINTCKECIKET